MLKCAHKIGSKRGFSLIEVMTAIFVSVAAIPAIAYVFSISSINGSDENLTERAYFLANSLMNEISERRFRESAQAPGNGADAGEVAGYSRLNFNDIDDYNIYKTTWGALNPPRDFNGNVISESTQFSQYVEVANIAEPSSPNGRSLAAVADGSTNTKLVTVKITWDGGRRKVVIVKIFSLP